MKDYNLDEIGGLLLMKVNYNLDDELKFIDNMFKRELECRGISPALCIRIMCDIRTYKKPLLLTYEEQRKYEVEYFNNAIMVLARFVTETTIRRMRIAFVVTR